MGIVTAQHDTTADIVSRLRLYRCPNVVVMAGVHKVRIRGFTFIAYPL